METEKTQEEIREELKQKMEADNIELSKPKNIAKANMENTVKRKIAELETASKEYKNKDVVVKIAKKNYTFFGGRINGQKYKEAYDLAVLHGMPKGAVGTKEGLVEVSADDMNNILRAIGTQAYVGWKKLQYYKMAVAQAKTVKEVEAIVWEDKRA